ncbi:uncharacterized protein Tco025E_06544 [Trypanosoma conorhini]|uniref:Uncharacterized protein n=1 Tax=Trypanosoma conorhini TaxID=83891 RepID=A0A3S5ISL2_9TRYP|nr:uncharacterized protein Tco025E_06544 [Trypanosoma conorhini]RNF11974.1 hypothetical protein Tco025E_06544 [Trypanosoma conorhini]
MSERVEQSLPPVSENCVSASPTAPLPAASTALRDIPHLASLDSTWGKGTPFNTGLSAAALPLTSTAGGRGGIPNVHGRRKGGPMTLYVRSPSVENKEFGSRDDIKEYKQGDVQEENVLSPAEGDTEESWFSPVLQALHMGATVTRAVRNAFPGVVNPPKRRCGFTGLLLFIFFMVVFIFLLHVAEDRMQWLSRIVTYYNEQNLLIATSLTEQMLEKADELNELMKPFKRTPAAALEKATRTLEGVTELRDASVEQLHSRMLYPGPVDDVKFLLEEHVAYKMNLARMVKEELQWLDEKKQESYGRRTHPNEAALDRKRLGTNGKVTRDNKLTGASRQQQGPSAQGGVSRPRIEVTVPKKVQEVTGGKKEHSSSYLLGRVVAVLVLFLLTVLYLRL